MLRLLVALALQLPSLTVQADRDTLTVGADLTVTIVATSAGTDPVTISDPEVQGLELMDRREQTQVSMGEGVPLRVTTRVLTLRAVRAGSALVGTVTVRQGNGAVESAPLVVTIQRAPSARRQALTQRERTLLMTIAPPSRPPDEVGLTVVKSSDTILLGEQVDILVVAWFPRSVREQLRTPPTLEAPNVRGAWVYPQPAPTEVALSRRVAGQWYDLYVLHQVVFPLTAGEMEIGPASVTYSVPLSTSFLSRELRRENRTERSTLYVASLPPMPAGSASSGAAGEGIAVSLDASTTELGPGGAAVVRVEMRGRGNVSLWPEPELRWPIGLRAYRQDVDVTIAIEDGRIGGSKAYEYLVVADSAGELPVPGVTYRYFDLGTRRYRDATTEPLTFASTVSTSGQTPLRATAPLMARSRWQRIREGLAAVPTWVWVIGVMLPPLAATTVRHRRRLWLRVQRLWRHPEVDGGRGRSVAEFERVLSDFVPAATTMSGGELAAALRAAGMESSLAAHAAQIRGRLQEALYGPQGATSGAELDAEVVALVDRLRREATALATHALTVALVVALVAASWQTASGQSAERLYAAGAVRAAADSFAARAEATPHVPAHWFNLGNAYQRLNMDARARAAWLRAGRLAPRDSRVRSALRGMPAPDRVTDRLTWISPVAPVEAGSAALALWVLGWVLVAVRARARAVLVVLGLAGMLGVYSGFVHMRYREPVSLVVRGDMPLRVAPYGSAASVEQLQETMAVEVQRSWGPWRLVSRGRRSGWLLETELVGI